MDHAGDSRPGLTDRLDPAAERVGDRWTLLVVAALLERPMRFGDLGTTVPGISTNVLAARLRSLEADGLVRSHPYSSRPVRMEYELTDAGRELAGALELLATWGRRQSGDRAATGPVHRTCGSGLVTRLWCPTCDEPVDDPDAHDLVHL